MSIEGVLVMLLPTAGIIGMALVRGDGDRRRTTAAALMIFVAYGLILVASKLAPASLIIAEGVAALAILIGIVGVGILVWEQLIRIGQAQRADSKHRATLGTSSLKGAWMQRLVFAAVFAIIGSLTLVLNGTWEKIETGVALFLVVLALSYVSAYRKA